MMASTDPKKSAAPADPSPVTSKAGLLFDCPSIVTVGEIDVELLEVKRPAVVVLVDIHLLGSEDDDCVNPYHEGHSNVQDLDQPAESTQVSVEGRNDS